jgi:hypothetical protein
VLSIIKDSQLGLSDHKNLEVKIAGGKNEEGPTEGAFKKQAAGFGGLFGDDGSKPVGLPGGNFVRAGSRQGSRHNSRNHSRNSSRDGGGGVKITYGAPSGGN